MKLTSPQVKNLIRRGLRQLLDPEVKREDRLRVYEFFYNRCAYCDIELAPGKGDLDHLISSAKGGSNHISNRVLSCKDCNAREKREMAWKDFLKNKCPDENVFAKRRHKIEEWIKQCGGLCNLPEETLSLLEHECKRVIDAYDAACRNIRNVKL